ncbi:TetR/AcrR family transcriptional regulator [Pseudomonas sp. DR48]|uniref:TetR/AcrR family transcriptional regulator n=1 Tax=Pseudomonas sp. DR48 TaxID=2871095 RepID=UPI0021BD42FF|nr:TetR/AcrR family transcriptional regulator [Pseudomonas sp. DR48]
MPTSQPQTPSLRERKKEKFRQNLINTATELFREGTVTSTRMEDIAANAEAAVTTVYNYFPNKHALLIAIIENQVFLAQERVHEVLSDLPADPQQGILAMIAADYGDVDSVEDKRFWRELLAVMVLAVDEQPDIEHARRRFRASLKRAIEVYIESGKLKSSRDADALVDIIYAIYAFHFRNLVCSQDSLTAGILQLVERDISLLFVDSLT